MDFRRCRRALVICLLVTATTTSAAAATGESGPIDQSRPPAAGAPADKVRIAAAGDIACEPPYTPTPTTCRHAATARMIGDGVDAVLPLGDTQYETGNAAHYLESYDPTWGRFLDRTLPVVGNHEYRTPGATGYYEYFGDAAHGPDGYYARNLGRWRLYVLNTFCPAVDCQAELDWLRQDLRAHPARRCSLAAMHHPGFSSGEHGDSIAAARFWPVLDRHQVDVVLAGHDHDYERFAPMTATGEISAVGIRSFVVGTGGKDLRPFPQIHRGSRLRSNTSPGVLFMSLRPGTYVWRFRGIDGELIDIGDARCVS